MKRNRILAVSSLSVVAGLASLLSGCALAGDLINPSLAQAFGLDLGGLTSRGTVLVALVNESDTTAVFNFWSATDTTDFSQGTNVNSLLVDPNSTRSIVVDCPVAALSPGFLSGDFEPQATAVVVDGTELEYGGEVLIANQTFFCGDVVEIRLTPSGDDFVLFVRVLRGR